MSKVTKIGKMKAVEMEVFQAKDTHHQGRILNSNEFDQMEEHILLISVGFMLMISER